MATNTKQGGWSGLTTDDTRSMHHESIDYERICYEVHVESPADIDSTTEEIERALETMPWITVESIEVPNDG